jgi:predicted nucleotidyltransferase
MMTETKVLNRQLLHDPERPVSRIASALEPYLEILVERFAPERLILFGSYAYGRPNEHSDVDLLVVMPLQQSAVREAMAIRRAWREVAHRGSLLPFDLVVESPQGHAQRLSQAAGFYDEINRRGLILLCSRIFATWLNNSQNNSGHNITRAPISPMWDPATSACELKPRLWWRACAARCGEPRNRTSRVTRQAQGPNRNKPSLLHKND